MRRMHKHNRGGEKMIRDDQWDKIKKQLSSSLANRTDRMMEFSSVVKSAARLWDKPGFTLALKQVAEYQASISEQMRFLQDMNINIRTNNLALSFVSISKDIAGHQSRMAEIMQSAISQIQKTSEQLQFNSSLSALIEQTNRVNARYLDEIMKSTSFMSQIGETEFNQPNIMKLADLAGRFSIYDSAVTFRNSISAEDDNIWDISETESIACGEILSDIGEKSKSINEYVENVLCRIAEIDNTKIKQIVWLCAWWIFTTYCGKVLEQAFAPEIELQSQKVRKFAIAAGIVSSSKQDDVLANYRLVRATVILREAASTDSRQLGELPSGAIVCVQEISTHWAFVEWHSDNGSVAVSGWVARNYLSKLIGTVKK